MSDIVLSQIKKVCHLKGVRQVDLAQNLNIKPSQMNLYFRGFSKMRADRFVDLLNVLGIDLESVLNNEILRCENAPAAQKNEVNETKVLAKIGRLDGQHRESLYRIAKILSEQSPS